MQECRHRVHLTHTAPVSISPGQLIFYDVIDEKTVARSSVLSGIAEAGGDARLPEDLSVSEFRAWITACATSEEDRYLIGFPVICTIVKAAIAVDDQFLDEWVQLAANSVMFVAEDEPDQTPLEQQAASGTPSTGCIVAQSLASMHQHAQSMILSQAYAGVPTCMFDLLERSPQSLHTAIVDAAIKTPDRTLEACFQKYQPLPFLDALAALPADPPSIVSLHINFRNTYDASGVAPHVATALRHHSALAALRLSIGATTAQAELLAPAIASLSSLQSLHLGCRHTHFPADAIPALQAALHSLPQLDSLLISLDVTSQQPTLKRQRDADPPGAPPPAQHCLATLLASAPGLTFLHIELGRRYDKLAGPLAVPQLLAPDELFPDGSSVSLRRLCHLVLKVDECSVAARLLRSLNSSPLTNLVVELSGFRPVEEVAECNQVAQSLSTFPQLRSMHINNAPERWAARALCNLLQTPPTALTALQRLSELKIELEFDNLHMAAPHLAAAMPALRRMTTICRDSDEDGLQSSPEGWAQVLEHLSSLQLHLDLSITAGSNQNGPGLSALVPLTGLSALQLQDYDMMRAPADVEALSRMTQLRSLHLIGFSLPAELQARLVPALLPLQRLTELFVVDCVGVHVKCGEQMHGAWPEVRHLRVSLDSTRPRVVLRAIVRAMCGLPALRKLDLYYDGGSSWGEGGRRAVGGEGCDVVPASMLEVAAAAGVALHVDGIYTYRNFVGEF